MKYLPGHNNQYAVYENGDVISFKRSKPRKLKIEIIKGGYNRVAINVSKGVTKHYYVHRLVAQAFLENPYNLPEVNHKDFNKSNNRVDNLEWVTRQDNSKHFVENYKKVLDNTLMV